MFRLTDRASKILRAEVQRRSSDDLASQIQRDIVFKRLDKLQDQIGPKLTLEELRATVSDLFPDFSEQVLRQAARANRPPGPWGKLTVAAVVVAGAVGGVYIANLPYPMIRWPVSRVAPILLLPSFMNMDHHYRQAIARVEQADQLVNQATGPADIDLGEQRVQAAQNHLDQLPVWFLGYFPQRYCTLFQCSWQFTFDEFQAARKSVGRMDAKVFQEKNALTQLNQGEQSLQEAKERYQGAQAASGKSDAIAEWQEAIDRLQQIPPQTLAGRMVETKLVAYERDFRQVAGFAAGNARTGTLIEAAKQFAMTAAQAAQNPPHSATQWSEIITLWDEAIDRLEQVPLEDPGYVSAQNFLATYQRNRSVIRIRLEEEQASVQALEQAQQSIQDLTASIPVSTTSVNRNYTISQIQSIINQLKKVKPGTTAYAEAERLMGFAQNKLRQLQGS